MLLMHQADKFPRANSNCLDWFHHIYGVILLGLLGTAETGENFLEMLLVSIVISAILELGKYFRYRENYKQNL